MTDAGYGEGRRDEFINDNADWRRLAICASPHCRLLQPSLVVSLDVLCFDNLSEMNGLRTPFHHYFIEYLFIGSFMKNKGDVVI